MLRMYRSKGEEDSRGGDSDAESGVMALYDPIIFGSDTSFAAWQLYLWVRCCDSRVFEV